MPLNMQYFEHYWNGYYTSRPLFKELVRDVGYVTSSSLFLYSMEMMKYYPLMGMEQVKNTSRIL